MWEVVRALRDVRRDHHPDHPLHRGSRGDGRPHRRDQQGRDHPGRGQGRADAQARQEAADAAPAAAARRDPGGARAPRAHAGGRRHASWSTPTTRRASAPASPRCSTISTRAGIRFRDLQTDAELARGHLRRPGEASDMNLARGPRDLHVRDGAHRPHAAAEHRVAGDLDLALFRGVRRRHRLAHHRDRGRDLRRVHRAGADHADAADAEHRQRLVRHLFPADSPARSTRSCRRRSRPSRSCSATSARPPPSRSSSG